MLAAALFAAGAWLSLGMAASNLERASIPANLASTLIETGKLDAETATRYQLSGGFVFITLLMPVYLYYFPVSRLLPSLSDWIWLLVLGILCTVVAYDLFMKALQKIPAFTVNLSYNLEPIYGVSMAFIIYREDKELSPGFYYGFCLIILAVVLQTLRVRSMSKTFG